MTLSYQELLEESRKIYRRPHEVSGVMSEDDLLYCNQLYDELPVFEPATHKRATRKDYLMHNANDSRMTDLFMPKLQALFPGKELIVDGGNFTVWHEPVMIHTDGHQLAYTDRQVFVNNQQVLGYAVLIPLMTDTHEGTPQTVYFDQTYYGRNIDPNRVAEFPTDPLDGIDGFTNAEFNGDYIGLEHNGRDRLHGFSVLDRLNWNNGSAIMWHRSQFHCAANFTRAYNTKRHIIFLVDFKYHG